MDFNAAPDLSMYPTVESTEKRPAYSSKKKKKKRPASKKFIFFIK
jgi:hypothetical protein